MKTPISLLTLIAFPVICFPSTGSDSSNGFILGPNSAPSPSLEVINEKPVIHDTSLSQLLKDEAFCGEERLLWYYDVNQFSRMLDLCGFNYIRLKFDRIYESGQAHAKAAYFFSIREGETRLDSLVAEVTIQGTPQKTVLHNYSELKDADAARRKHASFSPELEAVHKRSFAGSLFGQLSKEAAKKEQYLTSAKALHDNFQTQLIVGEYGGVKACRFAFKLGEKVYAFDNILAADETHFSQLESGLDSTIVDNEAVGAYAIGYDQVFFAGKVRKDQKPVITLVSLDHEIAFVRADIQLESRYGLDNVTFNSGGFEEKIELLGKKEVSLLEMLPIKAGQKILKVTVTDIQDNKTMEQYEIYTKYREFIQAQKQQEEINQFKQSYANKNIFTKMAYKATKFGGQGLVGMPLMAILSMIYENKAIKNGQKKQFQFHRLADNIKLRDDQGYNFRIKNSKSPIAVFFSYDRMAESKAGIRVFGTPQQSVQRGKSVSFNTVYFKNTPGQTNSLRYKYIIHYENGKSDSLDGATALQAAVNHSTTAGGRLLADVKDSCFHSQTGSFDGRIREHKLINMDGNAFKNIQVLLYLGDENIGRTVVNVVRS